MSSDAGKRSKVSSNSDNNNNDEHGDEQPPAKWSLKSTSFKATGERCASPKNLRTVLRMCTV